MPLVAWTPYDEEEWQEMMRQVAKRQPRPQPEAKTGKPPAANSKLPSEVFPGFRTPDVNQGLPGAAGVNSAQRKRPGSLAEIPAVDPVATLGMNHQSTTLANIAVDKIKTLGEAGARADAKRYGLNPDLQSGGAGSERAAGGGRSAFSGQSPFSPSPAYSSVQFGPYQPYARAYSAPTEQSTASAFLTPSTPGSEQAKNRLPATVLRPDTKPPTSTQKTGQANKGTTGKQLPSNTHSKHHRRQTTEIQDPFFRQKKPITPLLDFGPGPVKEYIAEQARAFGVPVEIAMAVVEQESNFDINELNRDSPDYRLMQINADSWFDKKIGDKYGSEYVINPYKVITDWKYNVRVGMAILRDAYLGARLATSDPEEQVRRTYAHFHASPKHWNEYDKPGTIKDDVDKFMKHYRNYKAQSAQF